MHFNCVGAFYTNSIPNGLWLRTGGEWGNYQGVGFDASRISGVYKNDHHFVQPEANITFYIVKY